MTEKVTRRNFFRTLAAAPVVTMAAGTPALHAEVAESEKLVQWLCDCGAMVYAKRPEEEGETVGVRCLLGHRFALTWHGGYYSCRELHGEHPAGPDAVVSLAQG